ncbi:MAG: protein BatD [Bacteroidetes bacterium]|nr:protein BatD [Bacteroidota bacterium]MBK8658015.1 protein BatD [Bacteroidota bacterium]
MNAHSKIGQLVSLPQFVVAALCMFVSLSINAQVKFYATAPKSAAANQNFQLNYTIENGQGSNLKVPNLNDFQVLGGPNTSTSMQWVNGNVTQSVTYSYILRAKKEGTFKIGRASVNIGGANLESNELTIEITKAVAQQQQAQRQRNPFGFDPFEDPFGDMEEEPQVSQTDLQKQLKDEVFVKLSVNKNAVYKGEMLTATYKLYFRQNLSGFNISKAPAFDGFWSQEIELDPKRKPGVETVNGKQYNVVEILKYNLYPQRAGNLQVSPAEVSTVARVSVRRQSRSVFDDFFGGGSVAQVPLELNTNAAAVSVKELPEAGKPDNFSGAVGKYDFSASLSSKEAKTDEPITYSLKISGSGNLKFADAPVLQLPESFEVYDPKVKENISNSSAGMSGSKQYDYLIIPRQPGDYKLEAYSFSYFDPASGKYSSIQSGEFSIKVTGEPSKSTSDSFTVRANKADVVALGSDIRYIKTSTPDFNGNHSFFGSAPFAVAYASPFLIFIALIAVKKRNDTLLNDVVGSKRRKALSLAKKRLSAAEVHLKKGDKNNFYDEVSRALWGYLSHKLNIDTAELTKQNVEEKLLNKQVQSTTIATLKNVLSICEIALYTPAGEGSEMKSNYESAMNLIADLEDEIKNAA